MKHRLRPIWFVFLIVLFFGMSSESHASDSIGVTSATVIRLQLQSIADEVFDLAKLDPKGRVALWVEGEGSRSLAENAFVETLQKRSYTSVLGPGKQSEQILHVFLLSTDIKVHAVNEKYSERNIRIALEARTVLGMEREVHLLGTFRRETKDTAQVFPSPQLSMVPENEEEGVMQRLLTPLIIVSGAVLIVFLLFTVRS